MRLKFIFLIFLLFPALLTGNGGPVGGSLHGPYGNFAPVHTAGILLVAEDLDIVVLPDRKNYTVRAIYHLNNLGAARRVQFAVPVDWARSLEPKQPETIAIRLGASHNCRFVPNKDQKGESKSWCVTPLDIPRGSSKLEMSYRAPLFFEDWMTNKVAFTSFSTRDIKYDLSPAGYWDGLAGRISIRIDPGPFGRDFKVEGPPGMSHEKNLLTWELRQVDLKKIPPIKISFSPYKEAREEFRRIAFLPSGVKGAASSVLEPRSTYGPSAAFDGNFNTAWCEGIKGLGSGEWVEARDIPVVNPPNSKPFYYRHGLIGIAFAPGVMVSPVLFKKNPRIRRIEVQNCNGGVVSSIDFPGSTEPEISEGTHYLQLKRSGYSELKTCLRFRIAAVDPGSQYEDTCISEIGFVYTADK